ncbi:hypothetical protein CHS0354_036542 [Potamilus streckersoni]|uniref:Vitelline membrane outer layer protein 1 n=1 Tax=Potamilus streckersoni TaxID=2493646 RepID=A0AAE0TBD8_9BIVA|nr:hypothetical protein CHS0354_036542 [Potamilus streckersoni]
MILQLIFLLCVALPLEAFVIRQLATPLTVTNGAYWGYWQSPEFCPSGSFADGYSMKIEPIQYNGDDTALNAIKLRCVYKNGAFAGEVTSGQGPWGVWRAMDLCPSFDGHRTFLTAFALKVESDQGGGDDTGANAVKFSCLLTGSLEYILAPRDGEGPSGTYGSWSDSCPIGYAICGLKTKVEGSQGNDDDTALNDVKFYCCKF